MKKAVVLLLVGLFQITATADTQVIQLLDGERFWAEADKPFQKGLQEEEIVEEEIVEEEIKDPR